MCGFKNISLFASKIHLSMAGSAESSWTVRGREFTHVASSFSVAYIEIFLLDFLQGITATDFFSPYHPTSFIRVGFFLAEWCNAMGTFRLLTTLNRVLMIWTELLVPLRTCEDGVRAQETGGQGTTILSQRVSGVKENPTALLSLCWTFSSIGKLDNWSPVGWHQFLRACFWD